MRTSTAMHMLLLMALLLPFTCTLTPLAEEYPEPCISTVIIDFGNNAQYVIMRSSNISITTSTLILDLRPCTTLRSAINIISLFLYNSIDKGKIIGIDRESVDRLVKMLSAVKIPKYIPGEASIIIRFRNGSWYVHFESRKPLSAKAIPKPIVITPTITPSKTAITGTTVSPMTERAIPRTRTITKTITQTEVKTRTATEYVYITRTYHLTILAAKSHKLDIRSLVIAITIGIVTLIASTIIFRKKYAILST